MTPETRNARIKIWLVLVSVFVLGGITGAALDSAYRLRAWQTGGHRDGQGENPDARFFAALQSELNLNDTQAAAIRNIIDETSREYRALRAEMRPRYEEIHVRRRERIRALLSPEQQQQFDEFTKKLEMKLRSRSKHRH